MLSNPILSAPEIRFQADFQHLGTGFNCITTLKKMLQTCFLSPFYFLEQYILSIFIHRFNLLVLSLLLKYVVMFMFYFCPVDIFIVMVNFGKLGI